MLDGPMALEMFYSTWYSHGPWHRQSRGPPRLRPVFREFRLRLGLKSTGKVGELLAEKLAVQLLAKNLKWMTFRKVSSIINHQSSIINHQSSITITYHTTSTNFQDVTENTRKLDHEEPHLPNLGSIWAFWIDEAVCAATRKRVTTWASSSVRVASLSAMKRAATLRSKTWGWG